MSYKLQLVNTHMWFNSHTVVGMSELLAHHGLSKHWSHPGLPVWLFKWMHSVVFPYVLLCGFLEELLNHDGYRNTVCDICPVYTTPFTHTCMQGV